MKPERWQQIRRLFEQVVDLPVDEREAFLKAECGEDATLLEEVRKLMRAEQKEDSFMEPPPAEDSGSNIGTAPTDTEIQSLGEFQLREKIGQGGMGVVYLADQPSLNRQVAIKVLPPHLTRGQQQVDRFQREAQAVAKLEHPGIVSIYAVGEERGNHYFAMEYVEGRDLAKEIEVLKEQLNRQGSSDSVLPDSRANDYFRSVAALIEKVADAIHYAHERGIVHRDIKPNNILIKSLTDIKVVDFGLARDESMGTLTRTGDLAGTPHYMSPEQIKAQRHNMDGRTDVYSLGVVLYELLALQRPFTGKTTQEIIGNILNKEPKSVRKLNPRIPRDLELICSKSISKDAKDRYKTAADLRDDLWRFLNFLAIRARRPYLRERITTLLRRHPFVSVATALLFVSMSYYIAKYSDEVRERSSLKRELSGFLENNIESESSFSEVAKAYRHLKELRGLETSLFLASSNDLISQVEQRFNSIKSSVISGMTLAAMRQSNKTNLNLAREQDISLVSKADIYRAIAKAGQLSLAFPDDEWIRSIATFERWFPKLEFSFLESKRLYEIQETNVSYKIFNEFTGILSDSYRIGKIPFTSEGIIPGYCRIIVESLEGEFVEYDRFLDLEFGDEPISIVVNLKSFKAEYSNMIKIAGGKFTFEDPSPLGCTFLNSVEIEPFLIDEAEVSNGDYWEFMRATHRKPPFYWIQCGYKEHWTDLPIERFEDVWTQLPVVGVSWEDARAYAEWVGKRLPTHFEIELAFRGHQLLNIPWLPNSKNEDRATIFGPISGDYKLDEDKLHRAGYRMYLNNVKPARDSKYRHQPNGLFHSYGNVEEWTSSLFRKKIGHRWVVDEYSRIVFGGAWDAQKRSVDLQHHRAWGIGDPYGKNSLGFRCAKSITQKK